MYILGHFLEDRQDRIIAAMEEAPFATLITLDNGTPVASHLPFLVERETNGEVTLVGRNKSEADRLGAAAGLREDGGDDAGIMAGMIETEI